MVSELIILNNAICIKQNTYLTHTFTSIVNKYNQQFKIFEASSPYISNSETIHQPFRNFIDRGYFTHSDVFQI